MTISLAHITFDCANAKALAEFWSNVLNHRLDADANEFFATIGLRSDPPMHPALMFIQVPEPKSAKNRVHIDLHTDDLAGEVARVIGHGATKVGEFNEFGTAWSTLLDPEGNEFDIGAGTG